MTLPDHVLRCLLVEDSADDALLLLKKLRAGGLAVTSERVDTPEEMRAALGQGTWDLVISDFSMPSFSGLDALKVLQASGQDLPFIIVSGAMGEETAVAAMQAGVHDYLLKDDLSRLAAVVQRELVNADDRRKHRAADEKLKEIQWLLAETGRIGHVGGWEFQVATGRQIWTEEIYRIHELDLSFEPTVEAGLNFYTPESRPLITQAVQRAIHHGEPFDLELEIITARGNRKTVLSSGRADQERRKVYGFFQDITERQRALTALRVREEIFASIVGQSIESIALIEVATGRFLEFNRAAHESLGYTREEFATFTVADIHADLSAEAIREKMESFVQQGSAVFETQHRQRNGQLREVRISNHHLRLQGKDCVAAIWSDITERKRTEEAIGKTDRDFFSEDYAAATWREEQAIITSGEPIIAREQKELWADGRFLWVSSTKVPRRDEAGRITGLVGVSRDITVQKSLEEKFLHAQRLESIGMLASGIAHDLNNVLSPILFAAPLLQGSLMAEEDLRVLDMLEKSAKRGAGLVKQILGFARSTTGEFALTQVKHLIHDVISMMAETFPKNIILKHSLPADLWPVHGNATQIHQIFLNLCVNARDAMPQGGTLTLTAQNLVLDRESAEVLPNAKPGSWTVITVADDGTGIPADLVERIWEPFFTTKAPDKGTGLGLSTVRGIVLNHHGFIDLKSWPGRGTAFRVFLPAHEIVSGKVRSATPFALPEGEGRNVMLVDDDEAVRKIITTILEHRGFVITSFQDGREALENFIEHQNKYALVITDVDMPRLGGAEMTLALRKFRPDLRVLAISGLSHHGAEGPGVLEIRKLTDNFLIKPFTGDELLREVQRALQANNPR